MADFHAIAVTALALRGLLTNACPRDKDRGFPGAEFRVFSAADFQPPVRLTVGATVESGPGVDIRPGNALPLSAIPTGTTVHNVELRPGQGGKMVRSAGGSAQLVAKEGGMALLRLPSGEMRRVQATCRATIGQLSNVTHEIESGGKAGRSRWKGKRPTVRGTVMNPVDHPHGGGEGKNKGSHPVTPWGKPTLGFRTRNKKKASTNDIVRSRKRGKGNR